MVTVKSHKRISKNKVSVVRSHARKQLVFKKVGKPNPKLIGADDFMKTEANEAMREHIRMNSEVDLHGAHQFVTDRLNITNGAGSRSAKARIGNHILKNYERMHTRIPSKNKSN